MVVIVGSLRTACSVMKVAPRGRPFSPLMGSGAHALSRGKNFGHAGQVVPGRGARSAFLDTTPQIVSGHSTTNVMWVGGNTAILILWAYSLFSGPSEENTKSFRAPERDRIVLVSTSKHKITIQK